jgi:dTDP-glucose 4,6-dehydratase
VISGGAGFIGSHLVEALLDRGQEVLVLDNLSTGSRTNLEAIGSRPGLEVREQDVSRPVDVDGDVDQVLHLASPASPADFGPLAIGILEVGTRGTENLLQLALAKGARFLLASTSEVYGDPLVHPQPETYWGNVNSIGFRSCYDEAKRCAEAYTMAYHRTHGLETRIVRIFNTHGPRMRADDGRAVPNFITQALAGRPLTIHGDGRQTRSLCYVDDLVAGILSVLDSSHHVPFNLGGEAEVTVLELAQTIRRLSGSESEIVFLAAAEDDPRQRRPDLSRSRRLLGWEPRVPLDAGLSRTLEYFRSST